MYDERTRMIEQQLAANESARIRGIEQGIEQERKNKIISFAKFVKTGSLSKEDVAKELDISVEEFEKYL